MKSPLAPPAFARPAPHHVIQEFLGEAMVARLLDFALEHEADFTSTRVGRATGRQDLSIRSSLQTRNLGDLRNPIEAKLRDALPGALQAMRLSSFDLGSIEIQLVAHGDGAFYRTHIDTQTGTPDGPTRVLTGVYYFHGLPKSFSGGALRLHSILPEEQGGTHLDIEPDRDTLLLFPSWAPHQVRPVSCAGGFAQSRFAINCWFRQRNDA